MGRKRIFDVDQALSCAMREFWRRGYEGASIADLTEAMKIQRPSLYLVFGSKENLYRLALERYYSDRLRFAYEALEADTVHEVVSGILHGFVQTVASHVDPRGCLAFNSSACSQENETVRLFTAKKRKSFERQLARRLAQRTGRGAPPDMVEPAILASYITGICAGLSMHARAGASPDALIKIANLALSSLGHLWDSRSVMVGRPDRPTDASGDSTTYEEMSAR